MTGVADLTPLEERLLIDSALRGDKAALRTTIERVSRVVLREAARSLLRLRAMGGAAYSISAEDLRQEILALLFADRAKLLDAFDPGRASLASYIASIARTRIHNYLQRKAAAGSQEVSGGIDRESTSTSSLQGRWVMIQLLEALRADVNDPMWQTFVEVFVHERRADEAAKILGTSRGAIYLRVWKLRRRARALLRESLGRQDLALPGARDEVLMWLSAVAQKAEDQS